MQPEESKQVTCAGKLQDDDNLRTLKLDQYYADSEGQDDPNNKGEKCALFVHGMRFKTKLRYNQTKMHKIWWNPVAFSR